MAKISPDEIRSKYLRFFQERGHTVVASDSLVPARDPTLLFTGAGMNQFKDLFLGKGVLPYRRAASSQKCLRTQDLDTVGRTAYHHTFFEMLGNFSFGDYFKREAIGWAWEFVTKVLSLPKERIAVSVYKDDEEAYGVWEKEIRLPRDRISKLGAKSNFWPANAPSDGPNGPCGPCSEIFWDFGGKCRFGKPDPECGPECDCGRFAEFWNLVFTQFDRRDGGALEPLPQKNIDTGMGFERLCMILAGVDTNFATPLFTPILEAIEKIVGKRPAGAEDTARWRRIADHARAAAFCVGDGVLPSNEGRGYVLRKVIRRAYRDGRALGAKGPFVHSLVPVVGEVMRGPYPEIQEQREKIARILRAEEERFGETLERGERLVSDLAGKLKKEGRRKASGAEAFELYDTYGLPVDVAEHLLGESGFEVDRAGYEEALSGHRAKSRKASAISGEIFDRGPEAAFLDVAPRTDFLGYETIESDGKVLAILRGKALAPVATAGEEVELLLDRTPFYAESGGQVGDQGLLRGPEGAVQVEDAQKVGTLVRHVGRVAEGSVRVGDRVQARVEAERRRDVMRHHTATHLLHAALRKRLGTHVQQQGSLVAPDRLRFDFSHGERVPEDLLAEIESEVNGHILENIPLREQEMAFEEAKKKGALAFFGDKYGDRVRVVWYGDVSVELCGGTHCKATGEIGFFTFTGEGAVAAGIRRVEAVSGVPALRRVQGGRRAMQDLGALLKVPADDVGKRVKDLLDENRDLRQKEAGRKGAEAEATAKGLLGGASEIRGHRVLVADAGAQSVDALRTAVDHARKGGVVAVFLAANAGGKAALIAGSALPAVDAREWVKDAAQAVGGGGGGKPDLAQAGGKDPGKVPEAVARARAWLEAKLA